MKVLSLFDGMACGALAMMRAEIPVDRYVAFEIDKYAIDTSSHNFHTIEHRGDVFGADFTEFEGFDYLIGGSPCTYWSIAQKNNRETEASGMGWELFSQYVRALHEAKPRFFVYENNKSMSAAIRESITQAFGFEPIMINSALVSAQNRQRLYWVGKRNADGTYSKVDIEQPEDRGILLKDILVGSVAVGWRGRQEDGAWKKRYEAREDEKANALTTARTDSMVAEPVYIGEVPDHNGKYRNGKQPSQQYRVYSTEGKSVAIDRDSRKYIAEDVPTYAHPIEFDKNGNPVKAVSRGDGKTYDVYMVENGQITTKDKQYQIKLADGFYIIRKLTVRECMRLQTVTELYEFPVSDNQAYKMLGNGWTVDVIAHLLTHTKAKEKTDED